MKHGPHAMLFVVLPGLLCGQAKPRRRTLDEMLSLKTISVPKISPNGRFVVYQLRETELEE